MALFQTANRQSDGTQGGKTGITTGQVLRYSLLPEIIPRIRAMSMHFGHFAYLLALVFSSARLIPQGHPSVNAANIGQFGVKQVIAIAANNITWSKQNIDQIAIFFAVIAGIVLIAVQAILIGLLALSGVDNEANATSFFTSPNPGEDPILLGLAQIFGDLGGFWGHAFGAGDGSVFSTPFHTVVYQMLSIYSLATMAIALIIVIYYIMTVVGEAAKTGTPFGQRFNSLWAPVRLVVALGLLVPLGSGLNSAQYITLWIAKMGSGLGTTVWSEAASLLQSDSDNYVLGGFRNDWVSEVAMTVFFMEVCRHGYNEANPDSNNIRPMVTADDGNTYTVTYQKGEEWFDGEPYASCGSATVNIDEEETDSLIIGARAIPFDQIAETSRNIINDLVGVQDAAGPMTETIISQRAREFAEARVSVGGTGPNPDLDAMFDEVLAFADGVVEARFAALGAELLPQEISEQLAALIDASRESWAYAGVWYLELGRLIANASDAQNNARPVMAFGEVQLREHRGIEQSYRDGGGPSLRSYRIALPNIDQEVQTLVNSAYVYFERNRDRFIEMPDEVPEQCQGLGDVSNENIFARAACAAAALIIPEELTYLRTDRDVDPIATLVNAGYSIFQKAWTYIGVGMVASAASGIVGIIPGPLGGILSSVLGSLGGLAVLIGTLGLSAGFILYFLLPVLPFIYFFFAVVSWLMEIFEAIIAMPLWALSFLKIDGDGMPGPAAMSGFYLLLAILLRPALIVMGLIASVMVFHAVVFLLQTLFGPTLLVRGSGSTNGLETLIYGLIFAFMCYSAAITSFKLVDAIPNQILRWIGSNPGTFTEGKQDPVEGNAGVVGAAGSFIAGNVAGNLTGGASGMGQAAGKGLRGYTKEGRREDLLKKSGENEGLDVAKKGGWTADEYKHDPK